MKIVKRRWERLEQIVMCASAQDRITVSKIVSGRGASYETVIGVIPVWRYERYSEIVSEVKKMAEGVPGVITFSLVPPKQRKNSADARRLQILTAAVSIAMINGVDAISQNKIAERLGVSPSLIRHYYSAEELTAAVMQEAIDERLLPIIAQGVTMKDPTIMNSDINLRVEALYDAIR